MVVVVVVVGTGASTVQAQHQSLQRDSRSHARPLAQDHLVGSTADAARHASLHRRRRLTEYDVTTSQYCDVIKSFCLLCFRHEQAGRAGVLPGAHQAAGAGTRRGQRSTATSHQTTTTQEPRSLPCG